MWVSGSLEKILSNLKQTLAKANMFSQGLVKSGGARIAKITARLQMS